MKVTCFVIDNKSNAKLPTPIDIRREYYALKPIRPGSTLVDMYWWDINMWVKEKTFDDSAETLNWINTLRETHEVEWVTIV